MIEIDDVAARQRLHEIVAANKSALDAHVRKATELAEQAKVAAEAEEAALTAAQQRKAEAEATRAAAEEADADPDLAARPEPRIPPKPATMSLGAEEFKLDRQARQAAGWPKPSAPPAPPAAEEPRDEPRPSTTLKLGARDDDAPAEQDKSARKRPSHPEADDDMSGRTWLR